MFSKQEAKTLIMALGRKWLFPDFNNKLTWWVAGAGGAIILAATPLKTLIYNWLIDSAILNIGIDLPLADFGEDKADYWMGITLILAALVHNVLIRFASQLLTAREDAKQDKLSVKRAEVDTALFARMSKEFPASGRSVLFLKEHNFEFSFKDSDTAEVERFVYNGSDVDREFLNEGLEAERQVLLKKCRQFLHDLNNLCGPGAQLDSYTCIPEYCKGDWNLPEHVELAIKKLNEDSTACYESYSHFIRKVRTKLSC